MKLFKKLGLFAVTGAMAFGVGISIISQSNVLEARAESASISSFTDISGNIDANISYNSYKGGSSTNPAVYTNEIRLYQTSTSSVGGYITITAAAGYKISAFITTSGMATSLDYSVENATSWTGTKTNVAVDAAYSQSGLNASNVSIGCFGTTSGTRYYVKTLSITYAASTEPSISINSVPLSVNVSDTGTFTTTTANSGGATVTWSSNNACLTVNEATGAYTANSIGTATVTASMTVESVIYTATGTVNVSGPATISEVLAISTAIGSGNTTGYKVTVSGTITATATNSVTISDGTNVLLIYGTYSPNNAASKGWIINGTISFTGNIQNYNGTAEIVSPVVVSYTDDAIAYATTSNGLLDSECAALNVTSETWDTLASNYALLDTNAQARLTSATPSDANSAEIADFTARYINIVNKYGYTNFMGITIEGASSTSLDISRSNSVSTIVLIAVAGFTAIGGMFFFKRKREE